MNYKAAKLLVVESDEALKEHIAAVLRDAGYEVSTEYGEGMKTVLTFGPDAVVLGADPPQLDCCDLLSQLKGSEHTHNIRVVMLSPGGSGERTRGLDLGADDVLSVPFDSHELLSRVRSQLRNKYIADAFREQLRLVEENRNTAQQVVTAVNEERRTLRIGGLAAVAVFIIASLVFFFFYHRGQEQNTRVYSAITRMQSGMLTQQRLNVVENRLQKLESEDQIAQTIIQSDEPSVCLIHVVLAFRDHTTGLRLHYGEVTISGRPTTDEHNNPLLSLTGNGPEVHVDVFGTGFLASASGEILTNHHVAEPWWQNDDLKEMLDQGLEPVILEMTAYFPGAPHGIAIKTQKISSAADVAVLKGNVSELGIKRIALADGSGSAVTGGPVVLLGFPTALDAILARAGAATLQSIATASKGDPKQVMEELARRQLIRPVATQGHIGDVLPDKIVYDAQTASGGSGGPLFNNEGKVIGINAAMVREFGGSNFAIPVSFGKSLLRP
jgi:DNA-binding response OmpR family regulator/S1-C subfamily serine protease